MYKLMLYPERKTKISSLSKEEKWDFLDLLFEFNEWLDLWNTEIVLFKSDILKNRVIKMAFDFVVDRLVIDYNTYQNICKANTDRANKRRDKEKSTDGIRGQPTDANSNSNSNTKYIVLTEVEKDKLLKRFWEQPVLDMIEKIDRRIDRKKWGKSPYKDYYMAIINRFAKDNPKLDINKLTIEQQGEIISQRAIRVEEYEQLKNFYKWDINKIKDISDKYYLSFLTK